MQMKVVGQVITTTQYETSGTAYCNTHSYFAGSSRVCSTVTLSADGKSLRLQSDIDPFYAASKVTYALAVVATVRAFRRLCTAHAYLGGHPRAARAGNNGVR